MTKHYIERADCYGTEVNNIAKEMKHKIKGINFITPRRLFYIGNIDSFAEISEGNGIFDDNNVFGVTFFGSNKKGEMFDTLNEAVEYAESSLQGEPND